MQVARLLSWGSLLAGVASLGYAGLQGQLDVFVLLVVPVLTGTGPWASLGLLAAIAGLGGLMWTSPRLRAPGRSTADHGPRSREQDRRGPGRDRGEPPAGQEPGSGQTRGGGVILVGPIPIVWGSDRSALGWLVVGGIVLTLAAVGLTLVLR